MTTPPHLQVLYLTAVSIWRIPRYCVGKSRVASNRPISTEFTEPADEVLKEMHAIGTGRQRRLNKALRPKQIEVWVE
jgi:hypothetical protein